MSGVFQRSRIINFKSMNASVIIVAAGLGLRMGGPVKKPYIELEGKPLFLRSIEKFIGLDAVTEIILVVGGPEVEYIKSQWGDAISKYTIPVKIVEGGRRRQDSVYNGLQNIDDSTAVILVHDAVRPLVDRQVIENVIKIARERGAAIPAVPVQATLKAVDNQRRIIRTVSREALCMAQTPQGFRKEILLRAYDALAETGEEVTDDAQAVEKLGYPVEIVPDSSSNIKITTPEDLRLAKALLRQDTYQ